MEGYAQCVVDTTGAGDAFWGAFLSVAAECQNDMGDWTEAQVRSAIQMGNAAGAFCVKQKGAIVPYLTKEILLTYVKNRM